MPAFGLFVRFDLDAFRLGAELHLAQDGLQALPRFGVGGLPLAPEKMNIQIHPLRCGFSINGATLFLIAPNSNASDTQKPSWICIIVLFSFEVKSIYNEDIRRQVVMRDQGK